MKKNNSVYSIVFVCISCLLFFFFAVGLIGNPTGPQRLIFFLGMYDFFADFFNILRSLSIIQGLDTFRLGLSGYLPFANLFYYPFSKLDNYASMTLQEAYKSRMGLMSVFIFTSFSVFLLFRALNLIKKKFVFPSYVTISLVLSSIFFFAIERGNILLILSAAFVGFFICYYDSKIRYKRVIAMVSIALAATLKIYPVLFGFLYFEKRQYKNILLSAIITLMLIFVPFVFYKGGFANIPIFVKSVFQYGDVEYGFTKIFPRFNLANLLYVILTLLKFNYEKILSFCNLAQNINILMAFISIIFSCFIENKWTKISLLTMAVVFMPIVSGLYCGLYVFPMIVIFFSTLEERSDLFNVFTIIIFLIFLNPYQILVIDPTITYATSYNYLFINAALLVFWFVLLVFSGRQIVASKIIFTIGTPVINKVKAVVK